MRGIEFQSTGGRAEVVPPLQGGRTLFWDIPTQGFTLGCHMTGFQPSTIAALKGRNVIARAEGPGMPPPICFSKPCQGDTTMHQQARAALDAESAEVLGKIKALL